MLSFLVQLITAQLWVVHLAGSASYHAAATTRDTFMQYKVNGEPWIGMLMTGSACTVQVGSAGGHHYQMSRTAASSVLQKHNILSHSSSSSSSSLTSSQPGSRNMSTSCAVSFEKKQELLSSYCTYWVKLDQNSHETFLASCGSPAQRRTNGKTRYTISNRYTTYVVKSNHMGAYAMFNIK